MVSVYLVCDDVGDVFCIIFFVYGSGFWDFMYGFLVVDVDG